MVGLFVFVFGLILGSFFNVVLLRKNTGESVLKNGSRCFSCGQKLRPPEMVPVLSFIFQKGRCRSCGSKISWQYPAVEFLAGCLALMVYLAVDSVFSWAYYFSALSLLFLLAAYDFKNKIIDSHFLYAFAAFAGVEFLWRRNFAADLISSFLIALLFYLLWCASSGRWMGRGDADAAFWVSLFLGWAQNLGMLLFSFWLGGLVGAVLLLSRGKFSLKSEIPFAPFLAAAALAVWLSPDFFRAFYGIIMI